MERFIQMRFLWICALIFSGFISTKALAEDVNQAQQFQCLIVTSKIVGSWISGSAPSSGDQPRQVIIEGMNFGDRPNVYFGKETIPVDVVQVGKNNALDTVTINLPATNEIGKYSIAIENTTGPFFENNPEINPIFCFGSIDFRVKVGL